MEININDYKTFTVEIPENEGGGFCTRCKQFGWSVVGDGETEEASINNFKECLKELIKEWNRIGITIPRPE